MNSGRLLALLILLFGAGYLWMAMQIGQPTMMAVVGPRVFPLAIGIGLVVSALWLFGWPGAVAAAQEGATADTVSAPFTFDWLRAGLLLLFLSVYLLLYRPLGYILSTALFMLSATQLLGERATLWRDLITAVLLTIVTSFVFARLLGINLPAGLVGW